MYPSLVWSVLWRSKKRRGKLNSGERNKKSFIFAYGFVRWRRNIRLFSHTQDVAMMNAAAESFDNGSQQWTEKEAFKSPLQAPLLTSKWIFKGNETASNLRFTFQDISLNSDNHHNSRCALFPAEIEFGPHRKKTTTLKKLLYSCMYMCTTTSTSCCWHVSLSWQPKKKLTGSFTDTLTTVGFNVSEKEEFSLFYTQKSLKSYITY